MCMQILGEGTGENEGGGEGEGYTDQSTEVTTPFHSAVLYRNKYTLKCAGYEFSLLVWCIQYSR